jgi:hypothetical protein
MVGAGSRAAPHPAMDMILCSRSRWLTPMSFDRCCRPYSQEVVSPLEGKDLGCLMREVDDAQVTATGGHGTYNIGEVAGGADETYVAEDGDGALAGRGPGSSPTTATANPTASTPTALPPKRSTPAPLSPGSRATRPNAPKAARPLPLRRNSACSSRCNR